MCAELKLEVNNSSFNACTVEEINELNCYYRISLMHIKNCCFIE